MTKLTTESLEKFVNDIKTDGMCDITDSQVESALIRLLAYEQAAKNPIGSFHISDGKVEATTDYCRDGEWPVQDGEVLVYAAPVLPKQSELVENLKKVMNNWLAMEPKLAFQPEFTDVMMLLDAEAEPAQPVSEPYKLPDERPADSSNGNDADTKRLNWLDAQNARLNEYYGTSYGWKFDANFQRNAMILNDCNFPVMTVRQAIDEAMLAAAPAQEGE